MGRCTAGVVKDSCLFALNGGFKIFLYLHGINAPAGSGNLLHCGLHTCVGEVIHDSPANLDGLIGSAVNIEK